MTQTPLPVESIGYAVPGRREGKVGAGLAIAFVGLVLVFFGGCFTIGIMFHLNVGDPFGMQTVARPWTPGHYILHTFLYLAAIGCFASGAVLILRGTMGLTRVLWSGQP